MALARGETLALVSATHAGPRSNRCRVSSALTVVDTMANNLGLPTLAATMDELTRRGFTEHFITGNGMLRAANSGKLVRADEVMVVEYHRYEGVSDPDDMAILYALETLSGLRGTLADAFGVYADPEVGAFMRAVALRTRR
jgi:hypothetical protein